MKVLFVCTVNRLRSPTAETLFSTWSGVEALSVGTDASATTPVISGAILDHGNGRFVWPSRNKIPPFNNAADTATRIVRVVVARDLTALNEAILPEVACDT